MFRRNKNNMNDREEQLSDREKRKKERRRKFINRTAAGSLLLATVVVAKKQGFKLPSFGGFLKNALGFGDDGFFKKASRVVFPWLNIKDYFDRKKEAEITERQDVIDLIEQIKEDLEDFEIPEGTLGETIVRPSGRVIR